MEEKKTQRIDRQPRFDVWVDGLPTEQQLSACATEQRPVDVRMMRRSREQRCETLLYKVPAVLKVLSVTPRRREGSRAVDSTHKELAVEVEVAEDVARGNLGGADDGLGLSAFKAGTRFMLVYWPYDQMARVSRSSDVLFVQPEADEPEGEAGEAEDGALEGDGG